MAIDADLDMPDLHVAAGVPGDPTAAALAGGARLAGVVQPVAADPRIGVIPGAPGVTRTELQTAIDRCRETDSVALVDCPAGAGPDTATAVRRADRALVVTTDRPASVRDAAKTVRQARAIDTAIVGVVVTRAETVPDGLAGVLGVPAVATGEVKDPLSPNGTDAFRDLVALMSHYH